MNRKSSQKNVPTDCGGETSQIKDVDAGTGVGVNSIENVGASSSTSIVIAGGSGRGSAGGSATGVKPS